MSIVFFDSGIGGLTVLHEALAQLPNEHFIYTADTRHVPYGTKTKEQVLSCVMDCIAMTVKEADDVKALVVACNTATGTAIRELRKKYDFPVIGMEPAVKPAVEMNRANGRRVLAAATPLTLRLSKYTALINRVDDLKLVDSLPLPELVDYCERLQFSGAEIEGYFKGKLAGFDLTDYGTLVLGCTHFPFYYNVLRKLLPAHMSIIDGSRGTVKRLKEVLAASGILLTHPNAKSGKVRYVCTGQSGVYLAKMEEALHMYSGMRQLSSE